MNTVKWNENAEQNFEILTKSAFLTTAHAGKINTMTISWGHIGFSWGKPIFTVMVRPSRHTFSLLDPSMEFTVTLPKEDMQKALALCGSKSGRDLDKFEAAGITTLPGQKVAAPIIECKGIHYECKVVYKQVMLPEQIDPAVRAAAYASGDYHTMYFGEIVTVYEK